MKEGWLLLSSSATFQHVFLVFLNSFSQIYLFPLNVLLAIYHFAVSQAIWTGWGLNLKWKLYIRNPQCGALWEP